MKDIFIEWMTNIAVFSLIFSVVIKLLPGNHYQSYVKLFAGIIFILIFLEPVLSLLGLENQMEKNIYRDLYEVEMAQMETELIQIEEEQKKRLEEEYKKMMEGQDDK